MLIIHATMCVININYSSDILFAALAASFRGVNGKFFKVSFCWKFLLNFAAEILFDVQFSASNTKLNALTLSSDHTSLEIKISEVNCGLTVLPRVCLWIKYNFG